MATPFRRSTQRRMASSTTVPKRLFGTRKTGIKTRRAVVGMPLREDPVMQLRREIREAPPKIKEAAPKITRRKERTLRALRTAGKIAVGTGIVAAGLTYGPRTIEENILTKRILWERFVQNNPQFKVLTEIADAHYKRMFEEQKRNPIFWNPINWDLSKRDWLRIDPWERKMIYQNMVEHYAKEYGADRELSVGIVSFESGLNPWARNRRDLGLGQLGPLVRKDLLALKMQGYTLKNGKKIDFAPTKENDYFDPHKNARATAEWIAYLSDNLDGNRKMIAMAYKDGLIGAKKGEAEWYWEWVKQRMEKRRLEKIMTEQGVPPWAIHTLTASASTEEAEKFIRAEHERNLSKWKQEEAQKATRTQHQQNTKNTLKMFGRKKI